jgi:hypothetical protein
MPGSLICPFVVEWGDVPTWIGAVATIAGAWFVRRIANRDREDRITDRREREVKTAQLLLNEFMEAVNFVDNATRYRHALPADATMDAGTYAQKLKKLYLDLGLATITTRRDISALSVELARAVRYSETGASLHRSRFGDWGEYSRLEGQELLERLGYIAEGIGSYTRTTADQLWEIVHPGVVAPWNKKES